MTPVFLVRSLPAKSTRFSLLTVARSSPSPSIRTWTCRVKTVWDLEEEAFSAWLAVDLLASPTKHVQCHQGAAVLYCLHWCRWGKHLPRWCYMLACCSVSSICTRPTHLLDLVKCLVRLWPDARWWKSSLKHDEDTTVVYIPYQPSFGMVHE